MTEPILSPNFQNLPPEQRAAVERLLRDTHVPPRVLSVFRQWLVWLGLSIAVVAVALGLIHPQPDLMGRLLAPNSGLFLLLAFFGSAFTAWGGIASSMPGEEPGPLSKILTVFLLAALLAMPFLFFPRDTIPAVIAHSQQSHWFCTRTVLWVAFFPWTAVGWMVSKNASGRPGWTGAWLGVSAFLLGVGTVQLHCAHWQSYHMLMDHLMPMVLFLFIPVWAGTYWFSRWAK
jgi:hypothetical protein